ncbi:hypothetical protein M9458_021688, partial [Cirrhinus mrigala]
MDPLTAMFTSLAHKDLPLLEYAFNDVRRRCDNYHHPVDLPDTTGLSWREAIIQCLESPALIQSTARPRAQPTISPL